MNNGKLIDFVDCVSTGLLLCLKNIVCYFMPLLHHVCGQSAGWATLMQ
jgi:hypothetical protein